MALSSGATRPSRSTTSIGGMLTWVKVVSLFCLLGWVAPGWSPASRQRLIGRGRWFDYLGVAALVLTPITVMVRVLQSVKRLPVYSIIGACRSGRSLGLAFASCSTSSGSSRPRSDDPPAGQRSRFAGDRRHPPGPRLGLAVGLFVQQSGYLALRHARRRPASGTHLARRDHLRRPHGRRRTWASSSWPGSLGLLVSEVFAVRGRRLYSIARLSIVEANRRMWAPWVVIMVFLLILAFTHWFLQPPRAAEMGRLYVGTLRCSARCS